jgi:DNA-binding transcriptional MocR family regulator
MRPRLQACVDAVRRFMPQTKATQPEGGFFISLTLPEGISTTDVRAAAAKRNLNLADGLGVLPEWRRRKISCDCLSAR